MCLCQCDINGARSYCKHSQPYRWKKHEIHVGCFPNEKMLIYQERMLFFGLSILSRVPSNSICLIFIGWALRVWKPHEKMLYRKSWIFEKLFEFDFVVFGCFKCQLFHIIAIVSLISDQQCQQKWQQQHSIAYQPNMSCSFVLDAEFCCTVPKAAIVSFNTRGGTLLNCNSMSGEDYYFVQMTLNIPYYMTS